MTQVPVSFTETQRKRRGHAWFPPKAISEKIPALYGTEGTPTADKIVYIHYFSAIGNWYIVEVDPMDDNEAFGYARLNSDPDGAEWGYIDLEELEQINAMSGLVIVERDIYWTPKPFKDIPSRLPRL